MCADRVDKISRSSSEQAQALPMILNAISNVEAIMIALTLIGKKVAAPLRQSLWDDKESEERVARILAISMGYAIHRPLLPLKSLAAPLALGTRRRSEEHTSELQSLIRISYAVFFLKKKKLPTIIRI